MDVAKGLLALSSLGAQVQETYGVRIVIVHGGNLSFFSDALDHWAHMLLEVWQPTWC